MNDPLERSAQEARQTNVLLVQIRDRLLWIFFALCALLGIVWRMSGEWPF